MRLMSTREQRDRAEAMQAQIRARAGRGRARAGGGAAAAAVAGVSNVFRASSHFNVTIIQFCCRMP